MWMSVNLTGVIALNPRPAQPFASPVGLFFHLRVPTAHRGGEIFPEDHLPAISQRPRLSCESKNKRGGLLDSEGKKTQQKKKLRLHSPRGTKFIKYSSFQTNCSRWMASSGLVGKHMTKTKSLCRAFEREIYCAIFDCLRITSQVWRLRWPCIRAVKFRENVYRPGIVVERLW